MRTPQKRYKTRRLKDSSHAEGLTLSSPSESETGTTSVCSMAASQPTRHRQRHIQTYAIASLVHTTPRTKAHKLCVYIYINKYIYIYNYIYIISNESWQGKDCERKTLPCREYMKILYPSQKAVRPRSRLQLLAKSKYVYIYIRAGQTATNIKKKNTEDQEQRSKRSKLNKKCM